MLAAASPALERCRVLDREFDTKAMVKPCQAAAEDVTASVADRVEALRRLAFAHILNGDEPIAEPTFVRMLAFSSSAELPSDAGPRFRQVFSRAKTRFQAEGAVKVEAAPVIPGPGPVQVQVDVVDRLGRVAGARIVTRVPGQEKPLESRLVRAELGSAQVRFSGVVAEPAAAPPTGAELAWEVVFDGWDGTPVSTSPRVAGAITRAAATHGPAAGPGDGGADGEFTALPWIIGGTAGGLAVLGGVVGGTVWCFTAGPCRTQDSWVRVQISSEAP